MKNTVAFATAAALLSACAQTNAGNALPPGQYTDASGRAFGVLPAINPESCTDAGCTGGDFVQQRYGLGAIMHHADGSPYYLLVNRPGARCSESFCRDSHPVEVIPPNTPLCEIVMTPQGRIACDGRYPVAVTNENGTILPLLGTPPEEIPPPALR